MKIRHTELTGRLHRALLDGHGATAPELRRRVADYAAGLAAPAPAASPPAPLPADCAEFIGKVAKHAYRVTADDIAALQRAGYSEDAIFELIASAATGAGLGRLERGLAALKGEV